MAVWKCGPLREKGYASLLCGYTTIKECHSYQMSFTMCLQSDPLYNDCSESISCMVLVIVTIKQKFNTAHDTIMEDHVGYEVC
jgi:hypothetical protein